MVLWALRPGPTRHGELRARIGGISAKVLTETLRRLEYNGLLAHRAGHYELTPLGRGLLAPLELLGQWAHDHGDEVMAAQEQADLLAAAAPPDTHS